MLKDITGDEDELLASIATDKDASTVALQPHCMSSKVVVRQPVDGPCVVLKQRGLREAQRERLVFEISRLVIGPDAPVGPCILLPTASIPGLPLKSSRVCTAEFLRLVRPRGCPELSEPLNSIASKVANAWGFADLGQAYLCTADGRANLPKYLPKDNCQCAADWLNSDFAMLLSMLDVLSFERLWLIHVISMQEDAGAPNLLFQVSGSADSFSLILTDSCDCFPGEKRFDYLSDSSGSDNDSSRSSSRSSSSQEVVMDDMLLLRGPEYEYPLILEFGLCNSPPSHQLQDMVRDINTFQLVDLLEKSDAINEIQRRRTIVRVEQLKILMQSSERSLRQIACDVVPEWGSAWARTADSGHRGPIRRITDG